MLLVCDICCLLLSFDHPSHLLVAKFTLYLVLLLAFTFDLLLSFDNPFHVLLSLDSHLLSAAAVAGLHSSAAVTGLHLVGFLSDPVSRCTQKA